MSLSSDSSANRRPHSRTNRSFECYEMGRIVCIDYGTMKREGERLEIYTGGINPCSNGRVSDL